MTGKCTDLKSESELSVRGTEITNEFLSVASGSDDFESFAASTFTGDRDNTVQDVCAICYGNPQRMISFATHFCKQCGLLGRFMCEKCLHYHNKFTEHTYVRSLKVAEAKAKSLRNDDGKLKGHLCTSTLEKDMDNFVDNYTLTDKCTESTDIANKHRELQKEVMDLKKYIKELEKRLQRTNIESKKMSFKLQLTEGN
ncbi:uncharacterized protein LOC132736739 isoform X2 [Ruditapes philippinarum]|uniref:uncharacterized protein LOC132736739 isoform X2 n=1 Tax=Ruditapes philippinarum TaxID=129788 RepID=UPI00295BEB13|nr:uncharacterized protein LOC132736739 isoform X2 [Ruditapes philippinarum]